MGYNIASNRSVMLQVSTSRLEAMSKAITRFLSHNLAGLKPKEPVVIFLHGYGADERDLPELMSYLPELAWLSPRATLDTQYDGYSWYSAVDLVHPTVEEASGATEALWEFIDQQVPKDSDLIVFGFSQGGLMATQLLRTRPSRIKATVILSGFVASGDLSGDKDLLTAKPKVIYCRGAEDQMIPKTAISQLNLWLQTHTKAITKSYPALGHSVDSRVMADVADYVQGQLS